MLVKDPVKRWTMQEVKKHPYFEFADWDELEEGDYTRTHHTCS